jgi:WxL domain surface cell wall-binding
MARGRLILAGLMLALVACAVAAGASADTGLVTGTVTARTLSQSTSATPSFSVTLNGTDQTASYTLPITVTDSRGSGAGWNLTVTSTQFTTGGGSPNTLSTSASTISAASATCNTGSSCTNPTNSVSYPLGLPAGATPPTAVKFFNAALTTGLGKFTLTPTVQVSVPANTYAGTYTSTVTLAIVSGP